MTTPYKLQVPMSDAQRELLDQLRGPLSRAEFARLRMFSTLCDAMPATVTSQDEAGEAIADAPPPPPKHELILPPAGHVDAQGWLSTYEPRSRDAGSLVMVCTRRDEKLGARVEIDLVGVELEPQADGSTLLRFADRSLVRKVRTEVGNED